MANEPATVETTEQAPNARRDRKGRIAVGPTLPARLYPWLRWGAPVTTMIVMPLATIPVITWDWWLRYPVAYLLAYAALLLVLSFGLAATHRTAWWDPRERTLSRAGRCIAAAEVTEVYDDYRRDGVTTVRSAHTEIEIPHSGWDRASYDGIRELQKVLGVPVGPTRTELMRRDHRARALHENRALAARYGMEWKGEYEEPDVFLAAFDARRWELAKRRR